MDTPKKMIVVFPDEATTGPDAIDPGYVERNLCGFPIDPQPDGSWKGETADPKTIKEAMEEIGADYGVDWNDPTEVKDGGRVCIYDWDALQGMTVILEY